MTTITATTILRSRHSQRPDKVLSTLLLRYPRWIHPEGRTHRLLQIDEDAAIEVLTPSLMDDENLSRNAGSSRAIPVPKLIEDVVMNPARPLYWGKNQRGMQANEELTGTALAVTKDLWQMAERQAIDLAWQMHHQGAHKQLVNRILEPYSHITVLVSATEWSNFLALRDHADAEPHIAMLAREVRKELDREDNIQTLEPGEWHMPFITQTDWELVGQKIDGFFLASRREQMRELLIKKSVACCASTSYKTVDGFDMTLEKAIEIHDKLVGSSPIHASPAEHVAQADEWRGYPHELYWATTGEHGNFEGFRQYRKMLPNECL